MFRRNSCTKITLCVSLVAVLSMASVVAAEQYIAEVTVERVNVRSGPSTNYYVVARLAAGTRVTVMEEESGWLGIVPPDGVYSLISKDYVDVGAKGEGVVNGSRVQVRAGSELDPSRYAVQTKLDKGAEVRVIGDAGDGYLKIAPPPAVRIWVHGDYLTRVPGDRLHREQVTAAAPTSAPTSAPTRSAAPAVVPQAAPPVETVRATTLQPEMTQPVAQRPATSSAEESATGPIVAEDENAATGVADAGIITRPPPASAMVAEAPAAEQPAIAEDEAAEDEEPADTYRTQLADVDTLLMAEMDKPVEERKFEEIIALYQPIAAQDEDPLARVLAERRIAQIEGAAAAVLAMSQIRTLSDDVTKQRRDALSERSSIRPLVRAITRGFDAKGELRESMLYTSPVGPRRYRLIDPDLTVPRTLCYVELPRDSKIDVTAYLGRLVGVRASERFIETETNVRPIPIVVAEELVVLDMPAAPADGVDPAAESAGEENPPVEGDRASVAAVRPEVD